MKFFCGFIKFGFFFFFFFVSEFGICFSRPGFASVVRRSTLSLDSDWAVTGTVTVCL